MGETKNTDNAVLKNIRLTNARLSLGMTMSEAARGIGISRQCYWRYESLYEFPLKRVKNKISRFFIKNGAIKSREEIFPEQLREFKKRKYSYRKNAPEEVSLPDNIEDLLPSEIPSPEVTIYNNTVLNAIFEKMETLDKRTRDIIAMKYGLKNGEEMTLESIGKHFGMKRQSVKYVLDRANDAFRQFLASKDYI